MFSILILLKQEDSPCKSRPPRRHDEQSPQGQQCPANIRKSGNHE